MHQDIIEKVAVPKNVEIGVEGAMVRVKGGKGVCERRFAHPNIMLKMDGNNLIISAKKATKSEKTMINTFKAHIKNMITGASEGFEYRLKICSSHFPMNVSIENKSVVIKNYIGEKTPRIAKILDNVSVNVEGDIIKVSGLDIESVGQTAANIEQATRRTGFDRRVFQDGIYMIATEKR